MNDDHAPTTKPQPTLLPFRAGSLLQIPTGASCSEDYRGVIDDLTIQNKKLKRKLRKYEKLHDSHLQDDKLFEIKVHSLPAEKKRELEDMLRKFSMTLEDATIPGQVDRSADTIPSYNRFAPPLAASTRFGDSAYASMSGSGQNSIAPSGQVGVQRKQPKNSMSQQQNQNIQSYLQDIPAGLLPKQNVAMTEKAKRKMVVRRLEQIFAGKGPAVSAHQQPIQQQEVAQSAARADRRALEDSGQHAREEGAREAQIMPKSKNDPTEHVIETPIEMEAVQDLNPSIEVSEQDFGVTEAPEQRPTRPLDLDPYRAQVPAENIEYIRHLGFSPMDAGSAAPAQDGHGWIYLNLLMNMAQLHTVNVTAGFVRRSIANLSKKLELSADGRKVRWKGGTNVTRTSSDSSPEDENRVHSSLRMKEPKPKQSSSLTMVSSDGSSENVSSSRQPTSSKTNSRDKLTYTPLFFHKADSEDDDEFSDDNRTSWSSPRAGFINAGHSSGFTSSGMRTSSSKKRMGDDGPIIFYNKATFCTDLSGDPRPRNVVFANSSSYDRLETDPVGVLEKERHTKRVLEERGPLSKITSEQPDDVMEVDNPSLDNDMEIDINSSREKSDGSSSEELSNPIEFEVSGIGGVLPQDNFAIRVKSRRKVVDDQSSSIASKDQQRVKAIPPHFRAILAGRITTDSIASMSAKNGPVVEEEILSTRRKNLPPSELPPASFFPFSSPDDEGEDSDSDAESEESSYDNVGLSHDRPLPTSAPQLMDWHTYDSGSEGECEDNDVENPDEDMDENPPQFGDESVDLLAHARVADPSAIRLREREYDANIADRLVEEIPAGSSAATAGGGSGFSSPEEGVERDEAKFASGGSSRMVGGLKRNRTSESVVGRVTKSPRMDES